MTRRRQWIQKTPMTTMALAVPLAAGLLVVAPGIATADVCSDSVNNVPLPVDVGPCADVLRQEARWLQAITDGDRVTVEAILTPEYIHTTSAGLLLDRAQEVAGTTPLPVTMSPSEQNVVLAGDTALVHGINTVTGADGTVTARERFTDVFVLRNGQWMALSAQETTTVE